MNENKITIKIAPVRAKIRIVSSTLTRRILPNRKLKISIVNPPEKLIITSLLFFFA